MDLLTVEHLTKTYGTGENVVHALDDVSFSVPRGQFLAIIGPSGSGKSTLLHILGGVDRPTSGHVYMNGEDVYSRSDTALAIFRRREVGLIYQFYNLIPVLNVVENITLPVLMPRKAPAEPALRRPAAARFQRPCAHQRAVCRAGRRADRQPRPQELAGDRGAAEILQPPVRADAHRHHA